MSIINKITKKFPQNENGKFTSSNWKRHGGYLWCDGVRYQPRDVKALETYNRYSEQRIKDLKAELNTANATIETAHLRY